MPLHTGDLGSHFRTGHHHNHHVIVETDEHQSTSTRTSTSSSASSHHSGSGTTYRPRLYSSSSSGNKPGSQRFGTLCTHWTRHCVPYLMYSLWKRKPLLLAIIIVSSFLLIALQYQSTSSILTGQGVSGSLESTGFTRPRPVPLFPTGHHPLAVSNADQRQLSNSNLNSDSNPKIISHPSSRTLVASSSSHRGDLPPGSQEETSVGQLSPALSGTRPQNSDIQQPNQPLNSIHQPNTQISHMDASASRDTSAGVGLGLDAHPFVPPHRIVHLDLKGAPPKISYLKQIFPLLKAAGATGILLEYEDMFPFGGDLKPATAGNAYSPDDIAAILTLAKIHKFEVIPLVQTFGHMEHFLKLDEFRPLREVDEHPQAICPSRNGSWALITSIIDQVMSMHSGAKWLHIGCDEVFHVGYCNLCRYRDREQLILNHVSRVAQYVRERHGATPIIWHDMLSQMTADRIREAGLQRWGVEIMVWSYVKDLYRFLPWSMWSTFSEVFPNVWGASAFKGAFGETLIVPNAKWHLENNEAWLEVLDEQKKSFSSIRGLVITGWQRYDHLATLCELLPAGLPSLILQLLTVSRGRFDNHIVFAKFDSLMKCETDTSDVSMEQNGAAAGQAVAVGGRPEQSAVAEFALRRPAVDLDRDQFLYEHAGRCHFPGAPVFRLTQSVGEAIKRVNDYLYDVTIHKAWLTDYNVRHNMTSPMRIDQLMEEYSTIYYTLTNVMRQAKEALSVMYDHYTVSEWIEQNLYPYVLKLEKVYQDGIGLKRASTWPRRPLPPLSDLKRFGV